MGMEQDNVYFSKRTEKKGEKSETVKVAWADRFSFLREGFSIIGNTIGVRKTVNAKGEMVNDNKRLTDFDSCKEIASNLKDDDSVFIRGSLDFSSFVDDKNNKRASVKLKPSQVSLCSTVNFEDENFKQANDFEQVIVYTGIDREKDDNGKDTGRFVLSGKIVTYSTIEDAEFIIDADHAKLANNFKKRLKPYTSVKVFGNIVNRAIVEEVEEDDGWGDSNPMQTVSSPTKREFIVIGVERESFDTETYTEENIDTALEKIARANRAESDYADSDDWGSSNNMDDSDDEAGW